MNCTLKVEEHTINTAFSMANHVDSVRIGDRTLLFNERSMSELETIDFVKSRVKEINESYGSEIAFFKKVSEGAAIFLNPSKKFIEEQEVKLRSLLNKIENEEKNPKHKPVKPVPSPVKKAAPITETESTQQVEDNFDSLAGVSEIDYSPVVLTKKKKKKKEAKIHQVNYENATQAMYRIKSNQRIRLVLERSQVRDSKRLHKSNKKRFLDLTRKEQELTKKIVALEELLTVLETNRAYDVLEAAIKDDLKILDDLIYSDNLNDKETAKELIEFYSSILTSDISPFFTNKQLATNRKMLKSYFSKIVTKAELMKVVLQKERAKIARRIRIGGKDYKKALKKERKEGLKDVNFLTKLIQDPQFQIGLKSNNGLIPQIANVLLEESFAQHKVQHTYFMSRLGEFEPLLAKILDKIGKGPTATLDYSVFFGRDSYGLKNKSVISRFTSKVFTEENQARRLWSFEYAKIQHLNGTEKMMAKAALRGLKLAFYKKHYEFMDITQIQEIQDKFKDYIPKSKRVKTVSNKQKNHLINNVFKSEIGYNEAVKEQIRLMEEYVAFEAIEIETMAAQNNGKAPSKGELEEFREEFHPVYAARNIEKNRGLTNNYQKEFFIHRIPKRNIKGEKGETGYYNEEFKAIEENETLLEFRNFLADFSKDLYNNLSPDDRSGMAFMSLPVIKKSLRDILADPMLSWYESISSVFKEIMNRIRNLGYAQEDSLYEVGLVNPLTGISYDKVKLENVKFNRAMVNRIYKKEKLLFDGLFARLKKGEKDELILEEMPHEALKIYARHLGLDPETANLVAAIKGVVPGFDNDLFQPYTFLRSVILNKIVEEEGNDLMKTLRTTSLMMVGYKARQEMLPIQKLLKDEFEEIKAPKTNSQNKSMLRGRKKDKSGKPILSEKRNNAMQQYKSWYNRAVLGKYEEKDVDFEVKEGKSQLLGNEYVQKVINKVWDLFDRKVEQEDFSGVMEDIDANIKKYKKDIKKGSRAEIPAIEKDLSALEQIKSNIEENFMHEKVNKISLSRIYNKLVLVPARFFGLAYNLNSAATNYMEGQISNVIAASTGRYFTEDSYWRAEAIMRASKVRAIGRLDFNKTPFGKESFMGAELARVLMDRYELLEDAYNEIQKAVTKSKLARFNKLGPQELVSRVEYQNQTPIMISILMETMITNKAGDKTISVWDAFMEGARDPSVGMGKLGSEWSTDQNKMNFEESSPNDIDNYRAKGLQIDKLYMAKITEAIVKIHGDYSTLRGSLLSTTSMGKTVGFFKRWLGSYMYNRFGAEHYNIRFDKLEKGRFRSLTATTGILLGAAAGVASGGLSHVLIGGVAFGVAGKYIARNNGIIHNLNFAQELILQSSMVLKRFVSMPVNLVAGGNLVNANKFTTNALEKLNIKYQEGFDKDDDRALMEIENIRGNLGDVSLLIWKTVLVMLVKGMLFDDEEEDDSTTMKSHNLLVNKLNSVGDQITVFLNPISMVETFTDSGTLAPARFLNNIGKLLGEVINQLAGSDSTVKAGRDEGEFKSWVTFRKTLMPSIARWDDDFGFGGVSEKQFNPTPQDEWFWSDMKILKTQIKGMRAGYKADLISKGWSDKRVDKAVRKTYKSAKQDYHKVFRRLQRLTE